nr:MAG: ACP S-malonyltransferase [actinobacterium acMicro-1]
MIVIVCPGQGSQKPGFLEPWLERRGARELLGSLGDACHVDLIAHGTTSDADTIRDTAIAQPLIVAAGILTLAALGAEEGLGGDVGIAGHSVGEFTAAAGAGVLDATDAVALVGIRGRAMAEAAAHVATGMSAVVGGDEAEVLAAVSAHGLVAANYNGGGQIVVAGELSSLAAFAENSPSGSRVIPLQVAGAFHTSFMESAVDQLRDAAASVTTNDPVRTLWTNRDGSVVTQGTAFRDLLVGQVSSPVRWDKCMSAFEQAGVTGIIELCPAGALVGLAKRGLKGVPTLGITTPDDLGAARELLSTAK